MRLLETSTLKLVEFVAKDNIPPYAILSHTWGGEEVTFQDLRNRPEEAQQMRGYSKIEKSCALARKYRFEYIWIDTCCINKESSAELSEAINSMYQYYQNSRICYAFLSDVDPDEDPRSEYSSFRRSRWFRRGWTLQELLAPGTVIFFGRRGSEWIEIGTKSSLQDLISDITRIPSTVLLQNRSSQRALANCSIAQKMSWAAKRETTRTEDLAYCLMGIFDVHMPPLYGEGGHRAFMRLQEQIIKYVDDQTIFAWRADKSSSLGNDTSEVRGLFARSPSEFIDSGNIVPYSKPGDVSTRVLSRYSITNLGLHMRVPLLTVSSTSLTVYDPHTKEQQFLIPKERHSDVFLAVLNCRREGRNKPLALYLQRENSHQYVRVLPERLMLGKDGGTQMHVIYVKQKLPVHPDLSKSDWEDRHTFELSIPNDSITILDCYPQELMAYHFNGRAAATIHPKLYGDFGLMKLRDNSKGKIFIVVFGLNFTGPDDNQNIWSDIIVDFEGETLEEVYQSYCLDGRRTIARKQPIDRVVKPLTEYVDVTMAVHKTPDFNKCLIEIGYEPSSKKISNIHVPAPTTYGFAVRVHFQSWVPSICGKHLLLPKELWAEDSSLRRRSVISFNEARDTGLIAFRNFKTDSIVFAVVLGVHQHKAWTAILTSREEVSLKIQEDSDLLLEGGNLTSSLSKTNLETYVSVPDANCRVRVSIRENQELEEETTHWVDIWIDKEKQDSGSEGCSSSYFPSSASPSSISSFPSFSRPGSRLSSWFHRIKKRDFATSTVSASAILLSGIDSKSMQKVPLRMDKVHHPCNLTRALRAPIPYVWLAKRLRPVFRCPFVH